jgi:hypothetical protein
MLIINWQPWLTNKTPSAYFQCGPLQGKSLWCAYTMKVNPETRRAH